MPPIKVRAVKQGTYRGHFYHGRATNMQPEEFWLVDQIDPETGQVLQSAEQALNGEAGTGHCANILKSRTYGWLMPIEADNAKEGEKAQRKADIDAERALEASGAEKPNGVGAEFDGKGKFAEPAAVPAETTRKGKRAADEVKL